MTEPIEGAEPSARETARLQAAELRHAQRRTDRRRRWIVRGGIALAILLVVTVVSVVLIGFTRPSARGPANMASDGILIGRGLDARATAALRPGQDPVPSRGRDGVVAIRVYIDYFQPESAAFQRANDAQLRKWLDSGSATLEIHPIAIATSGTDGAQYSLRAANAAACVAEYSPDRFYAFSSALLARQPDPTSSGLDNPAILRVARSAKVGSIGDVRRCVETQRFGRWAQAATTRATTGPLPDARLKRVTATPTVLIDGQQYRYADAGDARGLARAFVAAVGGSFSDDTSSPTPTPTPSPTG